MVTDTPVTNDRSMPAIRAEDGPAAGRRFLVVSPAIVGRLEGDIILGDPLVSRRHATIRPAGHGLEVEDLGSANGTFVNGTLVDGPHSLRHGDVIEIGGIRLVADIPQPAHEGTASSATVAEALLVVRDGPSKGQPFFIEDEMVIGRQAGGLTLKDSRVSRRHAVVRLIPGGLEIEDLHSTNGTRVDGIPVTGTRRLHHGDVVTVGRTRLEVHLTIADDEVDLLATLLAGQKLPFVPSQPR